MYRRVASRLRALRARSCTGALARSASSSSGSGGIFGWLTGKRSVPLPPLDIPLPGVILPPPLPDHVEPGKTKITTLSNGVKVASEHQRLQQPQ
ncbi:hypothetical protein K1719_009862 [Acacia pycnantha]|nr:hypothetical protein K1719_009862 [Acacia pycnantha]